MKNEKKLSYEDLKKRLATAEASLKALRKGEIDTIIGENENLVVRLEIAEKREKHIKRTLNAIRQIDKLIVQEDNQKQFIEKVCKILVEKRSYSNTWIAIFDKEQKFKFAAEFGIGKKFQEIINIMEKDQLTKCGQKALQQNEMIIVKDPFSECSDCPFASCYKDRSAMVIRLKFHDRIYGILTVSLQQDLIHYPEEKQIFSELAADISFALHTMEIEAQRQQVQADLIKSEVKFHTLYDTMNEGVVYQDVEGNIISANPAAERILGLDFTQMQGRKSVDPCWKSIHEDGSDFPGENHPAIISLKTGKPVKNTIMGIYHPKKDSHVWININSIPLFRENEKKPFQVYTTFQDITEQKKYQENIIHLNSLLRAISNINQLIIKENDIQRLMNKASNILLETRSYQGCCISLLDKNSGYIEPVFETGKHNNFKKWQITPQNIGDAPDCVQKALKTKNITIQKTKNCKFCEYKNDQTDAVCITCPMISKNEIIGFLQVGTEFDKSVQKQEKELLVEITNDLAFARDKILAEQDLKKYEKQIQNLMNNLPGMAYQCKNDKNWTMKFVSKGSVKLTGYTSEELIDNKVIGYNDLIHPADRDRVSKSVHNALLQQQPFELEYRIFTKENKMKWVWESGKLFFGKNKRQKLLEGFISDITARKAAEEDLAAIFQLSLDCICIADIETATFIKVNPAFTKILGYSESELLERSFLDFVHPDDRQSTIDIIEKELQAGREVFNFENRYRTKDNEFRWLNWASHPIIEKGLTYAIAHDITERKTTARKLEKSEKRFRKLIENSNDIFVILNEKGEETFVSDSVEKITGFPAQKYVGTLGFSHIHPDDQEAIIAKFQEIIKFPEKTLKAQYRHKHKNGSWIYLEALGVNYLKEPAIEGIVLNIRDITEQKEAEMVIRQSEMELREAQRIANIGSCLFNPHTGKVLLSDQLYKIIGTEKNAEMQRMENHKKFYTPESWQRFIKEVEKAMQTGEFKEIELEIIRENGRNRTVLASAETTTDKKGKVIEFRGILQDITERKKAEEELHKYREHLEDLVEERTEELKEKNEELERYNKLFIGREYRIKELKDKVKEMEEALQKNE